jgi:hypothetical protein
MKLKLQKLNIKKGNIEKWENKKQKRLDGAIVHAETGIFGYGNSTAD